MSNEQIIKTCKNYFKYIHGLDGEHTSIDVLIQCTLDKEGKELSQEEKDKFSKYIKAHYQHTQDTGVAILEESTSDRNWYKEMDKETYYYDLYEQYLEEIRGFAPPMLKGIEENLNAIMSLTPNLKENKAYASRGLIIGDVQSGKTTNYIGIIAKAADLGYRAIFVLTGTIETLRQQTQKRIEEGFIGRDSVCSEFVGIGKLDGWCDDKIPYMTTTQEKDFVNQAGQNTGAYFRRNDVVKIFVIKKNSSVLKKVLKYLNNNITSKDDGKINCPALIIDDEADNASVNTNNKDTNPTTINELLRKILGLFTQNLYIGYTATPFANVFIGYEDNLNFNMDLFPKDFIYSIPSPSNYYGAAKYFIESKEDHLLTIKDGLDTIWNKDDEPILFDSAYESIRAFFITNAIRDIREQTNAHRTMLINMSRFKAVQEKIKDKVKEYVKHMIREIGLSYKREDALANECIASIKQTYDKLYPDLNIEFNKILESIYDSNKNLKVVLINTDNKNPLKYDNESVRAIVIGGLSLSRGLTLEGLCISYFYRNTQVYDVLMQMARWFGYRDGYDDLCKVYLLEDSAELFKEAYGVIRDLIKDIEKMSDKNKRPKDFAIRVRDTAGDLTARNKRRNAAIKQFSIRSKSEFEAPYIESNTTDNEFITKEFLNTVARENVDKNQVADFIARLKIHDKNDRFFYQKLLVKRIKNSDKIGNFDIKEIPGFRTIKYDGDVYKVGNARLIGNTKQINEIQKPLLEIYKIELRENGTRIKDSISYAVKLPKDYDDYENDREYLVNITQQVEDSDYDED